MCLCICITGFPPKRGREVKLPGDKYLDDGQQILQMLQYLSIIERVFQAPTPTPSGHRDTYIPPALAC